MAGVPDGRVAGYRGPCTGLMLPIPWTNRGTGIVIYIMDPYALDKRVIGLPCIVILVDSIYLDERVAGYRLS